MEQQRILDRVILPREEESHERTPVPRKFHYADISVLEQIIARILKYITEYNDSIPMQPATLTRFHSRAAPAISIADYLKRIIQFASVEKACLLILLVYIDRVCARQRVFTLSSLTVHRFIIAAITVSAKALCDSYCTNTHYARVGGISTQELNTLELEFLFLIDWELSCEVEMLQQYYEQLVERSDRYEFLNRPSSPLTDESVKMDSLALDECERKLSTFDNQFYVL